GLRLAPERWTGARAKTLGRERVGIVHDSPNDLDTEGATLSSPIISFYAALQVGHGAQCFVGSGSDTRVVSTRRPGKACRRRRRAHQPMAVSAKLSHSKSGNPSTTRSAFSEIGVPDRSSRRRLLSACN